ncbi:TolC family protein [Limnoglobus roseus]|uniref:TolC family protein n=1 Tax=Limnoglobus roseus TaxID=2598579 RepID=A0A5C1AD31_9BACT|nr:TolC family protein [Limnoglobus roseus]QEL16113.1 TolC family protein [Limnoglobus roseus]
MRWRLLILVPVCAAGCTRTHYRTAADRETYPIIGERIVQPAYAIGRTQLEAAPMSRLADPTNPDRPPKPPDDPAAAIFMQHPYKFRGYGKWEKDGVLAEIEPPGWEENLGRAPNGVLKLTQDRATELALENSREYQTRLENVYVQALALTLNRFDFDLQFFARRATNFTHIGGGSLTPESNTLLQSADTGFSRNLAAGGQLLTDFANSFVWEFNGQTHTAAGSIGVSLIQPLLRGFGRNVRLETLTQGERDTLYAVRDFARFRKLFWASVNVDSGGYLQILRQIQGVRNAAANLKSQEENYALYRILFQGGRTQVANVDQVYQALLSARRDLISAEIGLQNALDQYKLLLGLPPRLLIELDDTPLNRFQLVDPDVDKLRTEIDVFERKRKSELDAAPPLTVLQDSLDTLRGFTARADQAVSASDEALKLLADDLKRTVTGDDVEQQDRARAAYEEQKAKPAELRARVRALQTDLRQIQAMLTETNREAGWKSVVASAREAAGIVDAAIAAESVARIYTIRLPETDFTEEALLPYAKENRLDLQNTLGQVTDSWRKVSVAANALKSDLTVRLDGNLNTEPGGKNPLAFGAEGSRLAAGVQFDGPLNRQFERNVYRQSLITYQRARRSYMALSDSVELDVRTGLRELKRQRINFEIARQQLLVAVRQLAIERRLLTAPVQGGARGDDGAATLRILNAQQSLLAARNGLADGFFNYEQQRIQLLINSEMMRLDARGFPDDATARPAAAASKPAPHRDATPDPAAAPAAGP